MAGQSTETGIGGVSEGPGGLQMIVTPYVSIMVTICQIRAGRMLWRLRCFPAGSAPWRKRHALDEGIRDQGPG